MAKVHNAIGLIGPMAAGKTECADYLESVNGFEPPLTTLPLIAFSSSKYLEQLAVSKGLEPTRRVKQNLHAELEEEYGEDAIVGILYTEILNYPSPAINPIIDSIRSEAQAEKWLKLVPNMMFLYLEVDDQKRFERYNIREVSLGRDPITANEFEKLHDANVDNNIERLKKYVKPHRIIDNNEDSLGKLKDRVVLTLIASEIEIS